MATKRKTRKFADGGVTDDDLSAANASDDPIAALNAQKGWTGFNESAPVKAMSFKDAFASARKAGDSTFTWNGKKYTTELASSKKASPAPSKADTSSTPSKASSPAYETRYDRMNRQNREAGVDFDSLIQRAKDRIAGAMSRSSDEDKVNLPSRGRIDTSNLDRNTLLPSGMKRGGSVKAAPARKSASSRADGIAQRGKTRGKMR